MSIITSRKNMRLKGKKRETQLMYILFYTVTFMPYSVLSDKEYKKITQSVKRTSLRKTVLII